MSFTRWDQSVTTEETNSILGKLALEHVKLAQEGTQGKRGWHLSHEDARPILDDCIRIQYWVLTDCFAQLCDYDLSPGCYTRAPLEFYHLQQALAFYRKREDLELGVDREAVAYGKFVESERRCEETNSRFKAWGRGELRFDPDVEAVIFTAQRKISQLLGPVPSLSDIKLRFGPGATTNVKRKMASARNKLAKSFACSEELLPAAASVLAELPAWVFGPKDRAGFDARFDLPWEVVSPGVEAAEVPVQIHDGKLSFVRKNAKTDRTVVTEPVLNSMCQLGIGDFLVRRLRRLGLDLKDQTRNQSLARMGSLTGALATLDLSSASDLISREIVYHLLPLDWAAFLARFRTGTVVYKGERIRLQKFSSMGNGYTFPLESVIFYALSLATTQVLCDRRPDLLGTFRSSLYDPHVDLNNIEQWVGVYGDDIIVPTDAVELLVRVLDVCGFVVNTSKSFWTGPFRESCGKDYLSGIDVRPYFQKKCLMGADLFTLHNFYVRSRQPEMASLVLAHIAEPLRLWGPDGYGDGHLIGEDPSIYLRPKNRSSSSRNNRGSGWGGWTFETYSWLPCTDFRMSAGDYVLPSYSVYGQKPWSKTVSEWLRYGDFNVFPGTVNWRWEDKTLPILEEPTGEVGVITYRGNLLGTPVPGTRGYRRIKIYTLNPF